jgi:opacity protein-like surface antigen
MRGKFAITLVAVAVLAAMPAQAAAKRNQPSTFKGSCELTGTVAFSPALMATPQQTHAIADAAGPCTGTWRKGKRTWDLDGDEVVYHAETDGSQSCGGGEGITGAGFLRYRGRRLAFTLEESRVAVSAELQLTGQRSGAATGTATAEGDPTTAVQSCSTTGLAQTGISGTLETAPRISGSRPR